MYKMYRDYYIDTLIPTESDRLTDEELKQLLAQYQIEMDQFFKGPDKVPAMPLEFRMSLYLDDGSKSGLVMLHHPMVKGVYIPEMNNIYNLKLKANMALTLSLFDELGGFANINSKDENQDPHTWKQIFECYHESYWMTLYLLLKDKMSHENYWDMLRYAWSNVDNVWQIDAPDLRDIWTNPRRPILKNFIMDERELDMYDCLPDEVEVYRGYSRPSRMNQWCWTLSLEKAWWFADRAKTLGTSKTSELNQPKVACRTISKDEVLAVFAGRGESEVVLKPSKNKERITPTSGRPLHLLYKND